MKSRFILLSVIAFMILAGVSLAQDKPAAQTSASQSPSDQDIDMLRKDIRSQKKQIIAANLQLTDKEAEKFWPLYDQYTAELVKINDAKYAALKDYAANYVTLTDDQAVNLARKPLGVDESVAQLRLKYIPMFNKVISGKKTALFFQMDRRLVMMIDLQLSSEVPMVQP